MVNQQSPAQQGSFVAHIHSVFNSFKYPLKAIFQLFPDSEASLIDYPREVFDKLVEARFGTATRSCLFDANHRRAASFLFLGNVQQAAYKTNIHTTFILLFMFLLGAVSCTRKDTVGQQDRTVMAQGVQQAEQLPAYQQDEAISTLEAKVRLLEARNTSIQRQAKVTLAGGVLLVSGMVFCYLYVPYVRARQQAKQLELNRKEIYQELLELEEAMRMLRKLELEVQRHKFGLNRPTAEA